MLHAAPVLAQTTHPRGSVVYLRGVEYITQTTPKSSQYQLLHRPKTEKQNCLGFSVFAPVVWSRRRDGQFIN